MRRVRQIQNGPERLTDYIFPSSFGIDFSCLRLIYARVPENWRFSYETCKGGRGVSMAGIIEQDVEREA
jgi:hypothetical protein